MRSFILGLAMAVAVSGTATQLASAASNDESVAKGIATQLKESNLLKDYRVGVKYRDGVVWLSGSVTSQDQLDIAKLVVRNCEGVQHVVCNLEIEGAEVEPAISTESSDRPSVDGAAQPVSLQGMPSAVPHPNQLASRPASNMPVPYARAGRGVQPTSYCPGGNCMPGATMGPPAYGAGGGGNEHGE